MPKLKTTTLYLTDKLKYRLKVFAATTKTTISAVVQKAVQEYLERKEVKR